MNNTRARDRNRKLGSLPLALLFLLGLACNVASIEPPTRSPTQPPEPSSGPTTSPPVSQASTPLEDKWDLWVDGPHLRGANIYQRRVYPELDGPEFMGAGPVGPPYEQADFDRLTVMGANYVNVSHPGLFSEAPPYELDPAIQRNLDALLSMAAHADLFAVISFRTGPGRTEFTFMLEDVGDWFDEGYLNDAIWQEPAPQEGWVAMWRYTAERYRDNPIVVGYDLMVEPNANEILGDIWDPDEFHDGYGGTLGDWNQLHPGITAAIRAVDPDTPILVGAMGYSAVDWLPYLKPSGDRRTVYTVHQYAPYSYTHQEPGFLDSFEFSYPGEMDLDWDGDDESFDQEWLEALLEPLDAFAAAHGQPLAVNEYGLMRWQPGAAGFMRDQMALFERRGMNYALWVWEPMWEPWAEEVNAFNFRHGPDPDRGADVESSELMDVILEYWGRNVTRPSQSAWE